MYFKYVVNIPYKFVDYYCVYNVIFIHLCFVRVEFVILSKLNKLSHVDVMLVLFRDICLTIGLILQYAFTPFKTLYGRYRNPKRYFKIFTKHCINFFIKDYYKNKNL